MSLVSGYAGRTELRKKREANYEIHEIHILTKSIQCVLSLC